MKITERPGELHSRAGALSAHRGNEEGELKRPWTRCCKASSKRDLRQGGRAHAALGQELKRSAAAAAAAEAEAGGHSRSRGPFPAAYPFAASCPLTSVAPCHVSLVPDCWQEPEPELEVATIWFAIAYATSP